MTKRAAKEQGGKEQGGKPKKARHDKEEAAEWDAESKRVSEAAAAEPAGRFFGRLTPENWVPELLRRSLEPATKLEGLVPLGELPAEVFAGLDKVYKTLHSGFWQSFVDTSFLLQYTLVRVHKPATGGSWVELVRFLPPPSEIYQLKQELSYKDATKEVVTLKFRADPRSGRMFKKGYLLATPPGVLGWGCKLFFSSYATEAEKETYGRLCYGSYRDVEDFAHKYTPDPVGDSVKPERVQRSFMVSARASKAAPPAQVTTARGQVYEVGALAVVFDLWLEFLSVWCVLDALKDGAKTALLCQAMPCVGNKLKDIAQDQGVYLCADGTYPEPVLAKFHEVLLRTKSEEFTARTAKERKGLTRYVKSGCYFKKVDSQPNEPPALVLQTQANYSFSNVNTFVNAGQRSWSAQKKHVPKDASGGYKFNDLYIRDMRVPGHPVLTDEQAMRCVRPGAVVSVGFSIRASFDPLAQGALCLKRVPKFLFLWDAENAFDQASDPAEQASDCAGWEEGGYAPGEKCDGTMTVVSKGVVQEPDEEEDGRNIIDDVHVNVVIDDV